MSSPSQVNSNWPGWLARNDFRLARFIFAAVLLFAVSWPLACHVENTVKKAIENVTLTPKSATDAVSSVPARLQGGVPAGGATQVGSSAAQTGSVSDQAVVASAQVAADNAANAASISLRVWVYGLSLAALVGALAASLWTIAALCRAE